MPQTYSHDEVMKALAAAAATPTGTAGTGSILTVILVIAKALGPTVEAEILPLLMQALVQNVPGTAPFLQALQQLFNSINTKVVPPTS